MLSWPSIMSLPLGARRALFRAGLLVATPSLLWAGCLKTLDESLLHEKDSGQAGFGGSGATGASGGSGGLGASGGTGGGGVGASGGDAAIDSPIDSGPEPRFFAYDGTKYPVTNLASAPSPQIIASDDTHVFRTNYDGMAAPLSSHPLAGGSGTTVASGLQRPQAMVAPSGSLFVYVAGGSDSSEAGSLLRIPKTPGGIQTIDLPAQIERAVGIYASADGFAYVSAKAITQGAIALLRFSLSGGVTSAEPLYTSTDGNESGGDVVASGGCVYWISNGGIWVLPSTGGARNPALSTQVGDAVGIAADAANFYFTRANGEVWQHGLSAAGCTGGGAPEQRIASGFGEIGDLITYDGTVAWTAGTSSQGGGGIFTTPVGGIDITQIAPGGADTPVDIDQSPDYVVYATAGSGTPSGVRRVPKQPVGSGDK
jgi:hypothetical protein